MRVAPLPAKEQEPVATTSPFSSRSQSVPTPLTRSQEDSSIAKTGVGRSTIDIKYPKRYEDAPEMVQLLIDDASILIDFQHMSETQARRCLDYLDGARSVLSGNLKKVSNTMWLLTPANVTVNMEDLRTNTSHHTQEASFDFDMKR
nr:cell division protein SepF [Streptococcus sp. zg-70]